jgi:hypothetical protein
MHVARARSASTDRLKRTADIQFANIPGIVTTGNRINEIMPVEARALKPLSFIETAVF